MQQVIMDTSALRLPRELAKKIGSKRVMISEVNEGLLLTPIKKDVKPLRGIIKDAGLTMERFLELKHADKELEL